MIDRLLLLNIELAELCIPRLLYLPSYYDADADADADARHVPARTRGCGVDGL